MSKASSVSIAGQEKPNLLDPLDWTIHSHWAPKKL